MDKSSLAHTKWECKYHVVMDHGEIAESGSYEELLAKKGRYYEFYMIQYAGFATSRKDNGMVIFDIIQAVVFCEKCPLCLNGGKINIIWKLNHAKSTTHVAHRA